MSVVIRTADLKDIQAIAALSTQLGYPSSPAQIGPRLENISKDEDHGLFVAEMSDGLVVGFVHVYIGLQVVSDSEATIGELVVDKTIEPGELAGFSCSGLKSGRAKKNALRSE